MASGEACEECKLKCLMFHGKRKDSSPLVTTFHKIIFGDYDFSKYLCLPKKISQTIPVLVAGQDHHLEDTNGQRWQVTLGNKDDHLAFIKGWDKFFADHDLREGYILAFHFIAKSRFVVQIIDNTGFERFMFPVANGKKRKRSEIDVNSNEVGECQNLFNHSTKKQGSAVPLIPDSEARIHSQPVSKNNSSSVKPGDDMYQHVALGNSDIEQVFTINRDSGYRYEEGRSPLLDFINFEVQLRVDFDGSSSKRICPSTTPAECKAVSSILDENPVSAKVASREPPGKVAAPTFSNNSNVFLKWENVAEIVNDHLGDHQPVLGEAPAKVVAPTFCNNNNVYLKRENVAEVANDRHDDHQSVVGEPPAKVAAPTFCNNNNINAAEVFSDHHGEHQSVLGEPPAKVAAPTLSNNNNVYLKRENVAEVVNGGHGGHQFFLLRENRSQLHSECRIKSSTASLKRVGIEEAAGSKKHSKKYPKFERSDHISGVDEKSNVICKVVKAEPVDLFDDQRLDASALTFTVMVGSSEFLELPKSVTLRACMEKFVVNLKGRDKRIWPVLYHHKLGIKALTSGWKNFFMSNRLRIGDECAFILENEIETIFSIDVKSK